METLGNLIQAEREKKGYTIRFLAKKANISGSQLNKYESDGVKKYKPQILTSISKALDLPPNYFQQLSNSEENSSVISDERLFMIFDEVTKLQLSDEEKSTIAGVLELVKRSHMVDQVKSLLL
ncbi:MAG TPA: helix-turn-helix transcriptional regulator [Cyclobacteriaceae bacterium]|jgi:transcriptional regulator with XRE-family HTH domain|nr:helix-turn-helix transcriptional regulator [Cyclobacteriaceae bacterium]